MGENGTKIVSTRKNKAATDRNDAFRSAPNWLDQDFFTYAPNQKWAGDISCNWTSKGRLYLPSIFDLSSRRVIGWDVSNRIRTGDNPAR